MNRIKPAHWLIIPAMFVVGLVEYNIREQNIKADYRRLDSAKLRSAGLSYADFRGADLTAIYPEFAKLGNAKLGNAYLHHAKPGNAYLRDANLRDAYLSAAFLLAVDLRKVKNLTAAQLEGQKPPYLCHVALPPNIRGIDPNRNCDALPQIYSRQHTIPIEAAQTIVDKARKMQW